MSDPPGSFAPRSDGQPFDAEANGRPAAADESGRPATADESGRPTVLDHSRAPERMAADKVRCEACPVLCQISPGKLGACDRYGNVEGVLTRLDTLALVAKPGIDLVAWQTAQQEWDGSLVGRDAWSSSPASARERPTPTTSRRPSSFPRSTRGSTW